MRHWRASIAFAKSWRYIPPFWSERAEFIADAKANPGKINFASAGDGSVVHVSAELCKRKADVNVVHVADRGTPAALTDLFGAMSRPVRQSTVFHRNHHNGPASGSGVGSPTRFDVLSDVPAVWKPSPEFERQPLLASVSPRDTALAHRQAQR